MIENEDSSAARFASDATLYMENQSCYHTGFSYAAIRGTYISGVYDSIPT
jgi:hypothetical protein